MPEFKMPVREQNSNKGTFGKVLNFCGSENYIGASYLATVSSLKVGAGFSALATVQGVINSVSTLLPEAVYLTREQGLEKINEFSVVLIGCGLGVSEESKVLMEKIFEKINPKIPIVIDADGLNLLAGVNVEVNKGTKPEKKVLCIEIPKRLYESEKIITPHPLEASRLLGVSLKYILENLESSAKALSVKYKCITVLKTHRTVICDRDLNIHINQHGNSALAKSGSGDVLAGIIAGLLAQGMNGVEACKLGVYLHSRTGEIASEELTEYSVLASDIPKYLHKTIKEII